MLIAEIQAVLRSEIDPAAIREQLELLVQDPVLRSSRRSVQFLKYVVEQTLEGSADQIKERTIGVEVFGRSLTYDTNLDHVVRTAAIELRKRLTMYYGDECHRSELHIVMIPGSYVPRFTLPAAAHESAPEPEAQHLSANLPMVVASLEANQQPSLPARRRLQRRKLFGISAAAGCAVLCALLVYQSFHHPSAQDLFWKPVLDTPGFVLLTAGNVPDGPPTPSTAAGEQGIPISFAHKTTEPTLPFSDAVTMARVLGTLESYGKTVAIRQADTISFSDLRESPVVLIGAFNNEWSLRLTRRLRYSLALDPERHLIYIMDAKNPSNRVWSWPTDRPSDYLGAAGTPRLQDYALISRIWNSDTGHAVIVIGGLHTYGTEAAGEFLTDPQMMQAVAKEAALQDEHRNLQIVLVTTVTDGTAGPPRVLAVSAE